MWDLPKGVHEGAEVEWTQREVLHGVLLWVNEETGWATIEEPDGQLVSVPTQDLRPFAASAQLRLI